MLKKLVLLTMASVFLTGTALAVVILEDTETWSNNLISEGETFSWVHDYSFDPEAEEILGASLTLGIEDDQHNFWGFTFDDLKGEWAEVDAGGYTYDLGEVDTGYEDIDLSGMSLNILLDETFNVSITSYDDGWISWGKSDFYLASSTLSIKYLPVIIPEPGTIALLTLGVAGVILSRRRLSK